MRCNGGKVKLHRVGGVFFKRTEIFFALVWVPEDVRNDVWVRQGGKVDNASVQGIFRSIFCFLTKYVVGRNFEGD